MLYNFSILFSANVPHQSHGQPRIVPINKGETLTQIAGRLFDESIIENKKYFLWTASIMGLDHRVQAGKYILAPFMSNHSIIRQLTSGGVVQERVTIIEGISAKEIASLFSQSLDIDSTRFMQIVNDSSITESLGIDSPNLEGYLFPETYHFSWGVSEFDVVETLVGEFKKNIADSILAAAQSYNMTLHDLVILASIIEGEAVVDEERPLISAVFHNRLNRDMYLNADPTIQYIIPDGPRRLLDEDLEIDSPYNTYKNKGLPPGPINNPGLKSLLAAAFPSSETYLYFVATGEGGHYFSRTYAEHLEAKKKLDQLRKKIR
ncbi:hypothetical protein AMJ80_12065 [bacterium SM23_31]|nr:MAG: hypothetical protein AMJ80_12065 [bacterium SM23_31]